MDFWIYFRFIFILSTGQRPANTAILADENIVETSIDMFILSTSFPRNTLFDEGKLHSVRL